MTTHNKPSGGNDNQGERRHNCACHRPWHYGGKHSLQNVPICLLAYCWCKIWFTVELDLCILKIDTRSKYVVGHTTYHSDISTWISHHLSLVGYLEYIKIPPEESVYWYEITWIGIKDVSNPMPILYVDSSTGAGFFPSWPCVPTLNVHSDIWDHVESYAIHMILARRLRITFKPKTKHITFKQRVSSSVLPPLTEKAPLFVF